MDETIAKEIKQMSFWLGVQKYLKTTAKPNSQKNPQKHQTVYLLGTVFLGNANLSHSQRVARSRRRLRRLSRRDALGPSTSVGIPAIGHLALGSCTSRPGSSRRLKDFLPKVAVIKWVSPVNVSSFWMFLVSLILIFLKIPSHVLFPSFQCLAKGSVSFWKKNNLFRLAKKPRV